MQIFPRAHVTAALRAALARSPELDQVLATVAEQMQLDPATVAECMPHCLDCGRQLQADEAHYYGSTCEACESSSWAAARQTYMDPTA